MAGKVFDFVVVAFYALLAHAMVDRHEASVEVFVEPGMRAGKFVATETVVDTPPAAARADFTSAEKSTWFLAAAAASVRGEVIEESFEIRILLEQGFFEHPGETFRIDVESSQCRSQFPTQPTNLPVGESEAFSAVQSARSEACVDSVFVHLFDGFHSIISSI